MLYLHGGLYWDRNPDLTDANRTLSQVGLLRHPNSLAGEWVDTPSTWVTMSLNQNTRIPLLGLPATRAVLRFC